MRRLKVDGPGPASLALAGAAALATIVACLMLFFEQREAVPPARAALPAARQSAAVTPETIRRSLEAAGFRDVRNIRRRGAHFSVEAGTGAGLEARIVIHGETGDLLGMRVVEEASGPRVIDSAQR